MKNAWRPGRREKAAPAKRFSSPTSTGVQDFLTLYGARQVGYRENVFDGLANWAMKNATSASPSFG
jgi:hypothetical protein